ncbi:MAG: cadmium-translocating P-type ATPase [Clostridia bacterium]|nr:cadmium-translocating P-type ATPase [Clostridia bacterium]
MKHHEHEHEEACHCHGHDHENSCHCHEHEHEHSEACHCHEHAHDGCGCGCGCEHGEDERPLWQKILLYTLGAIPVVLGFLSFLPWQIRLAASLAGYLLFGFSVWKNMLRGFLHGKIFTEFTLMCVASVGAFLLLEYADAAAVMYLYSLGETLSEGAHARSRKNISELIALTPEVVTVLREGEPIRVSPEEVSVGETILIVAGETVALDGVVLSGGGNADASSVTGESKPLELYEGILCPSGAILSDGSLALRVTAEYENSVLPKLRRAVEEASGRKSRAEKKLSRFASVFTPLAFCLAALIFLVGGLLTQDWRAWLHTALVVLVVSCPCSLVLSVPLTYFAGLGAAASRGIVFRGGEVMDSLSRVGAVAFDKTGTLTESVLSFDGAELYGALSEAEFLSLSRSVLSHSPHAAAISFCQSTDAPLSYEVGSVEILGGRGVVCRVGDKECLFGNAALLRERGVACEDSQMTAIFGALDGVLLGKLSFSSRVKQGSAEAISSLRSFGVKRLMLLSGDTEASVAQTAQELGLSEYAAALTPTEKSERLEAISREVKQSDARTTVVYCGDGLNDSAVVALADVGVAMGGCGSALTVSTADLILMDDDPRKLAEAISLSRRTSRIAGQNILLSLGIKLAVVAIGAVLSAVTGEGIPMGLAIVADVGAALLCVLNALRAARK